MIYGSATVLFVAMEDHPYIPTDDDIPIKVLDGTFLGTIGASSDPWDLHRARVTVLDVGCVVVYVSHPVSELESVRFFDILAGVWPQ